MGILVPFSFTSAHPALRLSTHEEPDPNPQWGIGCKGAGFSLPCSCTKGITLSFCFQIRRKGHSAILKTQTQFPHGATTKAITGDLTHVHVTTESWNRFKPILPVLNITSTFVASPWQSNGSSHMGVHIAFQHCSVQYGTPSSSAQCSHGKGPFSGLPLTKTCSSQIILGSWLFLTSYLNKIHNL